MSKEKQEKKFISTADIHEAIESKYEIGCVFPSDEPLGDFDFIHIFDNEHAMEIIQTFEYFEETQNAITLQECLDKFCKKFKIKKKHIGVVHFLCESPLRGNLFTYGNYCDNKFYCTGRTQGYA